jgi:hypothetical protein
MSSLLATDLMATNSDTSQAPILVPNNHRAHWRNSANTDEACP